MANHVLPYLGSFLLFFWGLAHLFITRIIRALLTAISYLFEKLGFVSFQ
jgi:hypothetical protein